MIAKGKSEPIVFIRQIYAYLLHRNMFLSDKEIAAQIDREIPKTKGFRKFYRCSSRTMDKGRKRTFREINQRRTQ